MTTWHSRLQEALTIRGIKPATLARYCGVKPPSVAAWLDGGTRMIGGKNSAKACELLQINSDWLFEGKQPSGLDQPTAEEQRAVYRNSNAGPELALGQRRRIGVVGTAQLGDDGYWAELEYPAGHGDGYIEHTSRDADAYALRCRGDSMKPRIKNGEFVIIEPGNEPINGDEVVVKCNQGRVMVKELLYVRDGNVHLGSVNEAHGKITIPLSDVESIHCVAAIVKSIYWKPD